jgi:hypothetical protein
MNLRWLAVGGALALVTLQWRVRSERDEAFRLAERVAEGRRAAAECTRTLTMAQAAFQALDGRVDSLRLLVQGFETLDPGGVPAARYEDYLDAFDRYNDAVTVWESSADSLRASEAVCHATIEAHNNLADSARRRLVDD